MKTEQLMEAIENIDDRYIEESAYGIRKTSRVPWGMIITAACFCLAIGATIFMQNMNILPHLHGTTATTGQPMTTEPSNTAEPGNTTEPFRSEPDPAELQAIDALFQNRQGWYYRAAADEFTSPEELHLRYYFYNTEFGEGLTPTKEEMDELMVWEDYQERKTLKSLPVSKMNEVLTAVFGITVDEMESSAFAGLKYVESIDSWCFWSEGTLNTPEILTPQVTKESKDTFRITYRTASAGIAPNQFASYELILCRYEDSYYIRSNVMIESNEQPTEPPKTSPSVEEFFSDRGNWQNYAILDTFSDRAQVNLAYVFERAMDGESMTATDLEHEKLASVVLGYDRNKLFRATKAQMDEVLLALFNIRTDQLTTDWERNFVYLPETGCYYARGTTNWGYSVKIFRTEECDDGTILMYYSLSNGEEPYRIARLQPHATGYYILSNEEYVDNTGKSEDQIAMETLFRGSSWFNQALTSEYASPKEMSLLSFFYNGFKDESQKPTDQEWAQLKDRQGFNINYDLFRLPVDKMNAVLTEYFGITLADMEPEAFSGLVYLESTDCYYCMHTGWLGVQNFTALSVDRTNDGTVLVRYKGEYYEEEYVITLKPNGDGYRILSNVLAEPFRPYAVDAAQLNALFQEAANGNLKEQRKDELLLPLLGTFLEDPELFVDSLGKQQQSQTGVMHIFASRIKYTHPRYAAYNQTIREMLPKVQSEEEKRVIYRMAFNSGLGNFLSRTPGAQDYALLFDMALYSDGAFAESCADWLKRYCMADPKSFTAAMALTPEENWEFNAQWPVSVVAATQEERLQIKESMNELVAELSVLDGYDIYDQIQCAKLIIESCDAELQS